MKKALWILIALTLVLLSACGAESAGTADKATSADSETQAATNPETLTYTIEEMKLTLPYAFCRLETGGNWSGAFSSAETMIQVQRIDKSEYQGMDVGYYDFAKNQQLGSIKYTPSPVTKENDMAYFDYEATLQDVDYRVLYTFFESDRAFWMIVFTSLEDSYAGSRPLFFEWIADIRYTE